MTVTITMCHCLETSLLETFLFITVTVTVTIDHSNNTANSLYLFLLSIVTITVTVTVTFPGIGKGLQLGTSCCWQSYRPAMSAVARKIICIAENVPFAAMPENCFY